MDIRRKIEERSIPEPNSGCWLWLSYGDRRYGTISMGGKSVKAHRASYEAFRGPIDAGKKVCHRCDVTWCVNPNHLFLGTQSDNLHDAAAKGRNSMQRHPERSSLRAVRVEHRGDQHARSKLTTLTTIALRRDAAAGTSMRELGRRFNISARQAKIAAALTDGR